MPNKYRQVRVPDVPERLYKDSAAMDLTAGVRKEVSALEMPLGAAPDMERIRLEDQGIRQDFGFSPLGGAASQNIIALGLHRYIDDQGDSQSFLYRVYREETNQTPVIETWNGSSWVEEQTTSETIDDVKLSTISIQGALIMSDGTKILIWDERLQINEVEDDFPSGNSITAFSGTTSLTTSDSAHDDDYEVSYDVEVSGTTDTGAELVLVVKHGSEELFEKRYSIPGSLDLDFKETWDNVAVEFEREIPSGDSVVIEAKEFNSDNIVHEEDFTTSSATEVSHQAEKSRGPDSAPGSYVYIHDVTVNSGTVTVGYYYNDGSGWVQEETRDFTSSTTDWEQIITSLPSLGEGDLFGIVVESGDGSISPSHVRWEENTAAFDVHGHNKATDGDDPAGLVYDVEGSLKSSFGLLSDQAPAARYITSFGDRVVALRDGDDPQSLAWSADGLIDEWQDFDSGQVFLVDTRSDPLDDLQAAKALTSDALAIFRKRSIMRAVETGNVAQAISIQHWIEDTGTLSPMSVAQSEQGIWFLSNHMMPTVLTQNGLQAVGQAIHEDIVADVTSNLELVESTIDHVFRKWYLGVPTGGSSIVDLVWVFDIGRFVDEGDTAWTKRPMNVQRMATVNRLT